MQRGRMQKGRGCRGKRVPREEGRKREEQRGNRGKRGMQRGRHAERKACRQGSMNI
jgi:hypothetical protein